MFDDDEFSDYGFQNFTEEELEQIGNAFCGEDTFSLSGAASVSTQVEQDRTDDSEKDPFGLSTTRKRKIPQAEFKKKRNLSVSDLTNPAWCEVQYDYRLRQGYSLPLKQRPEKFESSKGKTITVQIELAVQHDKMTREGNAVHKQLERAMHPEVVKVKTSAQEERWALRLLDLLAKLVCLRTNKICREVKVWGIIHDEPVTGIIDELRLVRTTAEKCGPYSVMNQSISSTSFKHIPRFLVQIRDHKTRASKTIPAHADTLPSRLQLMLYHYLFRWLMSATTESLVAFWSRMSLDIDKLFSEDFVKEIKKTTIVNALDLYFLDSKCLRDLIDPYQKTLVKFEFSALSDRLSLVYRERKSATKFLRKNRGNAFSLSTLANNNALIAIPQHSTDERTISEDDKIIPGSSKTKGIETLDDGSEVLDATLSLNAPDLNEDLLVSDEGTSPSTAALTAEGNTAQSGEEKLDTSSLFLQASRNSRVTGKRKKSGKSSESDTADDKDNPGRLIGTKTFYHREVDLNQHIADVLLWWKGKRPPRGVSIQDVNRCNFCEYRDGCEWREEKAAELLVEYSKQSNLS